MGINRCKGGSNGGCESWIWKDGVQLVQTVMGTEPATSCQAGGMLKAGGWAGRWAGRWHQDSRKAEQLCTCAWAVSSAARSSSCTTPNCTGRGAQGIHE